jgi:uncharacterized protein (UPF0297 family)
MSESTRNLLKQVHDSVNDRSLYDSAVNIAGKMGFHDFQASGAWITRFKQAHYIGIQDITKFVLRHYARDEVMIEQCIRDFLASAS